MLHRVAVVPGVVDRGLVGTAERVLLAGLPILFIEASGRLGPRLVVPAPRLLGILDRVHGRPVRTAEIVRRRLEHDHVRVGALTRRVGARFGLRRAQTRAVDARLSVALAHRLGGARAAEAKEREPLARAMLLARRDRAAVALGRGGHLARPVAGKALGATVLHRAAVVPGAVDRRLIGAAERVLLAVESDRGARAALASGRGARLCLREDGEALALEAVRVVALAEGLCGARAAEAKQVKALRVAVVAARRDGADVALGRRGHLGRPVGGQRVAAPILR